MTSAIITNTFFQRMALLSLQTLVQVSIDFFFQVVLMNAIVRHYKYLSIQNATQFTT